MACIILMEGAELSEEHGDDDEGGAGVGPGVHGAFAGDESGGDGELSECAGEDRLEHEGHGGVEGGGFGESDVVDPVGEGGGDEDEVGHAGDGSGDGFDGLHEGLVGECEEDGQCEESADDGGAAHVDHGAAAGDGAFGEADAEGEEESAERHDAECLECFDVGCSLFEDEEGDAGEADEHGEPFAERPGFVVDEAREDDDVDGVGAEDDGGGGGVGEEVDAVVEEAEADNTLKVHLDAVPQLQNVLDKIQLNGISFDTDGTNILFSLK